MLVRPEKSEPSFITDENVKWAAAVENSLVLKY